MEGRRLTKRNSDEDRTHRTPSRTECVPGLERVRAAARRDKKQKFTALLHHVSGDLLRASYEALNKSAAPGVDGVTWQQYGEGVEERIRDLHARIHTGNYRAQPSRGNISTKRMVGNDRWESPPWRIRSPNKRWLQSSIKCTRRTFWDFPTDFDRDAANTMRWMR